MNNLCSNIEFGQWADKVSITSKTYRILRNNFDKFLSKKLEASQFIPMDNDGNILVEPKPEDYFDVGLAIDKFTSVEGAGLNDYYTALMYWEDANERLLFKGLTIQKDNFHATKRTFYYIGDLRIGLFLEYYTGRTEFNFDLFHDHKTIEDLIKYKLEFTDIAKIEIGIK